MDQFNTLQDNLTGGNITQNQQNIIVFDDTTNRVLIGYQTVLQQWGLFVSQPGVDVTMANADQLIFNSEQDTFKIVKIVPVDLSFTLSASAGTFGLVQVPHNLTFTPAYDAYITIDPVFASLTDVGTVNITNPFTIFGLSGTTMQPEVYGSVTVDDTNINFEIITRVVGTDTLNNSALVYLLQETSTSS